MISPIELLIDPAARDLGGFPVRRALPTARRRTVGPFVFLDQMGPVELQIGAGMDVRPHPHIGLSTLTYLLEGEILHRDTLGFEQSIRPGAVNWMTAGAGIAHSERSSTESRRSVQKIHGLQTWIALPKEHEETTPSFRHHAAGDIPEVTRDGCVIRVIAGDFESQRSPVGVFSPVTYLDLQIPAGVVFSSPTRGHELSVFVVAGEVFVGEGVVRAGQLAVLGAGPLMEFRASRDSRIFVLGGAALPEPRHIWWNFVSSSRERLEQAKLDWADPDRRESAFGRISGESEFALLPER